MSLYSLGQQLKAIRKQKKMNQATLAFFCQVTQQTISNIERGWVHPHPNMLHKIEKALDLPWNSLVQERHVKPLNEWEEKMDAGLAANRRA